VKKPTGPPDYRVSGSLGGLTGCPVLTMDGRVVGVVGRTSVEPSSGGRSVTIGGRTYRMGGRSRRGSPRILCAESFKEFLADPSKFLRRRCWLGVRGLQAFSKDLAEHLEVAEKGGVILGEVLKQSPAAKAGLRDRDIVVKINGEKLDITEDRDVEKLRKRVQRGRAGDVLVLSILRDSDQGLKEVEVRLTLEEEPVREFEVEDWEEKTFGLRVKPLTRDFLDKGRLPLDTKGVRVTYVESAGWAYLAGVRSGDIIKDVVLEKTPDLAAFQKRMKQVIETREPEVCFGITRRGKSLFLCVRPQWELDAKKGEKEE
jgi:S1-C subfamily serine protease